MTDATSSGSNAGGHTSQLHDIHRLNHVLYGHLGRLSYTPSADDERGTGDLTSDRAVVNHPRFEQISSFSEWFAPTKSINPIRSAGKTSQSIRSQERWLLKSHPEAFLGTNELRESLAKEIPYLKASRDDAATVSLMAVGEINDRSSSWKPRACPALAMAAGEAGHILRVATLQHERWGWSADDHHEISLATTSSGDQGFWCADGVPITKIQFATVRKKYDQIRWLVVQKSTSTTIFQPEVRRQPVGDAALPCYLDPEKTSHISVNPIITLTQEDTDGHAHCDFSFNPGAGNYPPQIVIMTQAGGYSIWDIIRERSIRRTTLKPIRRMSGWLSNEPFSGNTVTRKSAMADKRYRVFWVTRNNIQSEVWDDYDSPSEEGAHHEDLDTTPLPGLDVPTSRCDMIMLSDHKSVEFVDTRSGIAMAGLEMAKQGSMDHILDVQVSVHNPSYAFVVTKTTLYWLDTCPSHPSGISRPAILLSCPHYRNADNEDLKLTVISERPNRSGDISLVVLFSPQTLRFDLFWFIRSGPGPTFHHQSVQIANNAEHAVGTLRGLESVIVIPTPLSRRKRKSGHASPLGESSKDKTRFLQIIGTGPGLSLNYCLATIYTDLPSTATRPDTRIDALKRSSKRSKFIQEISESFVVPDHVEKEVAAPVSIRWTPPSRNQATRQPGRLQLWRFVGRLFREVAHSLPTKDADLNHNNTALLQEVMMPIEETIERSGADGYLSLQPLSGLIGSNKGHFDIGSVESQWTSAIRRLEQTNNRRLKVLQVGLYKAKLNIADLFEALSILWSAKLPGDHLRPALWRRIEFALERIAVETYLSGRAIRLMPERLLQESTVNVKDKAIEDIETAASQSKAESVLPTPSTSPSSAQSSVSGQLGPDDAVQEDPAIMRLRTYATTIKPSAQLKQGESRLLSHWPREMGHDPTEYTYIPEESLRRNAERVKAWKKQQDDRRRRRAASQALLKQEESGDSSSQPLPRYAYSSQPQPASSQSQGPVTMSQPIAGQHGARATPGKKKAKKIRRITGGFR